jgi:hypothetical protein
MLQREYNVPCTHIPIGHSAPASPDRKTLEGTGYKEETTSSRVKRRKVSSSEEGSRKDDTDVVPVMSKWVAECFPQGSIASERDLREIVQEAADAARNDLDEESALGWAGGFEFPASFIESDVAMLKASALDFPNMVERRFKILAPDRLSAERVSRLRADNPERELMFYLAIEIKVFKPEGFRPNGRGPRTPLRENYVKVAPAVNRMLSELVKQKLAFMLPFEEELRHVPDLHFCKAHWCTKKGKASGRPLGDMSNIDGTKLNADAATTYHGQIQHPTINDIAKMVHDFWTE